MRIRRLRKDAAHLEITAFINLIVVLVPFLLSTAVFTRLSVVDLSLPAQSGAFSQLKADDLKLEVVIRPDALEVGDRIGGLIQRIPNTSSGHDLATLTGVLVQLKARFPAQSDATVLAEPATPYDTLVQVMDGVRATKTARAPGSIELVDAELFPHIAVGDAPVVRR